MRSAAINTTGDLMCARCLAQEEESDQFNDYIEDLDDDYLFEMAGTTKIEATSESTRTPTKQKATTERPRAKQV